MAHFLAAGLLHLCCKPPIYNPIHYVPQLDNLQRGLLPLFVSDDTSFEDSRNCQQLILLSHLCTCSTGRFIPSPTYFLLFRPLPAMIFSTIGDHGCQRFDFFFNHVRIKCYYLKEIIHTSRGYSYAQQVREVPPTHSSSQICIHFVYCPTQ